MFCSEMDKIGTAQTKYGASPHEEKVGGIQPEIWGRWRANVTSADRGFGPILMVLIGLNFNDKG